MIPVGTLDGYDVYCDMVTDAGGWLVRIVANNFFIEMSLHHQRKRNKSCSVTATESSLSLEICRSIMVRFGNRILYKPLV